MQPEDFYTTILARLDTIDNQLTGMATKTDLAKINQELSEMRSEMATKSELSEIRNEMATKKEVTNLESRFIKKLDLFFLALDRDVMHNRQRIIRLEEHLNLPRLQT